MNKKFPIIIRIQNKLKRLIRSGQTPLQAAEYICNVARTHKGMELQIYKMAHSINPLITEHAENLNQQIKDRQAKKTLEDKDERPASPAGSLN